MGGVSVKVGGSTVAVGSKPKTIQAKDSPYYQKRPTDQRAVSEERGREMMKWHKKTDEIATRNTWPEDGDIVGVRANLQLVKTIKDRLGQRIVVQTLHKSSAKSRDNLHAGQPGTVINYGMAFTVRNAKFRVNQEGRAEIATGSKAKFPMASVDGAYVAKPNEKTMFDGIEIRFNPMATHLFVDPDGRPIKSAEEVTVVGDRAYVRGEIEYYDTNDYPLPIGGVPTSMQLTLERLVHMIAA
jgi:hypothetical protein